MFYWLTSENQAKFNEALEYISEVYEGRIFASDMLITIWKNLAFTEDANFLSSFISNINSEQEESLIWRLHVLTWAAQHVVASVEGDFVECGVLHGFSSSVVCRYLDFANLPRKFYLYDTFSGLPDETSTDAEREKWNQGYKRRDSELLYKQVQEKFEVYPNVQIVRGIVPYSFQEAVPEKIAYLHVDMNSTQAEILALEELFPRMSSGGILILDDFGWDINREQAIAELEFLDKLGYKVLELPTGQGLVIKR